MSTWPDDLEDGFYKVKSNQFWTVLYYDGVNWFDHINGYHSSEDAADGISEVGEKIDLPDNETPAQVDCLLPM